MQCFCVVGVPEVPCLFIFGDSLSDPGNNNKLATESKVNFLPYGIDFPDGPTGRFNNGRTSVDILTQTLGFEKFIPPFANTSGSDILQGVNYASGSAGILKDSGQHMGVHVSFGSQIHNHKAILSEITKKLGGPDQAQQHLNKCLYYVNIGNNDYLNNYFMPEHYPSSSKYSPDKYASVLIQEYATHLKELHAVGARKFSLFGLGTIGCVPQEILTHGKEGSPLCIEEETSAAFIFNQKLIDLVDRFNDELPDSKFISVNAKVTITKDLKSLPSPGVFDSVCCKVGPLGLCDPKKEAETCRNRKEYLFFDAIHPTEMVNEVGAKNAYNSPYPNYAHPMDISHLVKL
uniref:GDSL esterase/lipase At4g18970 family n=2 Tax=Cajanus cajan TaxID=3821 RepID=A0A151R6A7_CAJCA|nr:GDSL esterase/lipase At4g18970 family [Cajanus cajan]